MWFELRDYFALGSTNTSDGLWIYFAQLLLFQISSCNMISTNDSLTKYISICDSIPDDQTYKPFLFQHIF